MLIRRDAELDNCHSVYVDQWDWEKIITPETRNIETLKQTVRDIVHALKETQNKLHQQFSQISSYIEEEILLITTSELEAPYPNLSRKERENQICKEHKTVFLMQIGGPLKDGKPHDGRAPDYDDWNFKTEICSFGIQYWNGAMELSSMGIRVDQHALENQLKAAGCEERKNFIFHQMLLNGELPLTMGGGIGQSRLCMVLLEKAHIGEVQASVWPESMISVCDSHGIHLL